VGRRILVIDDDADLRALISRALRDRGHEVVELVDGLAGLAAVQATSIPFDLVITNGRSPRLDGPQLADRLHDIDPTLPIIHIPASHSTRYDHVSVDKPTLFKPFNIWALVDEAEKLMQGPVSREWKIE
jgi:DNA-binding NtrC family response regulator